ncbi:MAG: hypothetical protein OK422_04600 [Thaumarchaeota archaeon]|nr:hypothetical protein [Nitrososphaerota archaeon]
MRSLKAVTFSYEPTHETRELLETFRLMVNHAIKLCFAENIKGRLRVRDRI